MLTIPDAIKTLFKTDGVFKNFRAHFPNGERADITNSNIVRESLKFTESACSESTFRFGGCERSVLEFETVGVENILGAQIQCGIEIDTTSLSAAQLTAIAADPGDGTLVLASSSDIGRGYYRVPLGTFVVASCPRNHEAMTRRQITAYSPNYTKLAPPEWAKRNWWSRGLNYTDGAETLVAANLGYYSPAFMAALGYSATPITLDDAATTTISLSGTLKDINGNQVAWSMTGFMRPYSIFLYNSVFHSLGGISLGTFDAEALLSFIRTELADAKIDYLASNKYVGFVRILNDENFIRLVMGDGLPRLEYPDDVYSYARTILSGDVQVVNASGPSPTGRILAAPRLSLYIPYTVTVTIAGHSYTATPGAERPSAWVWLRQGASPFQSPMLEIPVAGDQRWLANMKRMSWRSWDMGNVADIVRGWAEINGRMILYGRKGIRLVQLSQASPVALTPADVESAWWDEYDVEPVGIVRYSYGENHDKTGTTYIGNGGSVYDMTDNGLLALSDGEPNTVRGYIADGVAPALDALADYTPAEISMPAWPWLEPGDCIQFTASDGETFTTYIMRRTISGVQRLSDSIESTGGSVEDEDE